MTLANMRSCHDDDHDDDHEEDDDNEDHQKGDNDNEDHEEEDDDNGAQTGGAVMNMEMSDGNHLVARFAAAHHDIIADINICNHHQHLI